jgi:hypothetical protein
MNIAWLRYTLIVPKDPLEVGIPPSSWWQSKNVATPGIPLKMPIIPLRRAIRPDRDGTLLANAR